MRFIPVQLSWAYRIIWQSDCRDSLQLSPATAAVEFHQPLSFAQRAANRNHLDVCNCTNNFDFHRKAES
jgi:hypothetical protein